MGHSYEGICGSCANGLPQTRATALAHQEDAMPNYQQAPAVTRRTPRPLTGADAGVPLSLAGFLAALVALGAYALLTALFRAGREGNYYRLMPATRFWASVAIGCAVAGWWLLWRWLRIHAIDALFSVEEFLGTDVNRDGEIGRPTFRIERPVEGGHDIWELPGTVAQFAEWALAITSHTATTSERQWCGEGKLYSSSEYDALRDELMQRGIAKWRNAQYPQLGWVLTQDGYPVVQAIARGDTRLLPPPSE